MGTLVRGYFVDDMLYVPAQFADATLGIDRFAMCHRKFPLCERGQRISNQEQTRAKITAEDGPYDRMLHRFCVSSFPIGLN